MNFWETQEFKDEWEEISDTKWLAMKREDSVSLMINNKETFFKRKEKIQDVFEDHNYKIKVDPDSIMIVYKHTDDRFYLNKNVSLPNLIEAVEAWRKMQETK